MTAGPRRADSGPESVRIADLDPAPPAWIATAARRPAQFQLVPASLECSGWSYGGYQRSIQKRRIRSPVRGDIDSPSGMPPAAPITRSDPAFDSAAVSRARLSPITRASSKVRCNISVPYPRRRADRRTSNPIFPPSRRRTGISRRRSRLPPTSRRPSNRRYCV